MGRRNNRPALYELSRTRQDVDRQSADSDLDESVDSASMTWFTPGIGVRVPVGFLILACVLLVLISVGSWWLGFERGVSQTEQLMAERPPEFTVDPLLEPAGSRNTLESSNLSADGTGFNGAQGSVSAVSGSENAASEAPKAPWHFVLAETGGDGVQRLADFCRQQGLEVMVVPRNNTGLARIFALPGMTSSNRKAPGVQALDERIAAIGRRWKQNGGRTDFSDRYMDRLELP